MRVPAALRELLILVVTFAAVSAIAMAAGATNLGTGLTFGTIAFCIALVTLMVRGR